MIKLLLKRIGEKGLTLEGEEPIEVLALDKEDDFKAISSLKYKLTATFVRNDLLVNGLAECSFETQCGLCLKKFNIDVKNDEICHYYENANDDEIDLTETIREDILLMLPFSPTCRDDCLGLCLHCGIDLNNHKCDCDKDKGSDKWNELSKLEF